MMATEIPWVTPCPPTVKEAQEEEEEVKAEEDGASGLGSRDSQELESVFLRSLSFCDSGDGDSCF